MGPPLQLPPKFLYLEINSRCNLACKHCLFWRNDDNDRDRWLPAAVRADVIAEFTALGGRTLVTCGGEPMLDLGDYFEIARLARVNGLRFFSVSNGSMVDEALAERIIAEGPDEITISLDGLQETHDHARGTPGSFEQVMRALRLSVKFRNRAGSPKRIYAMTILCERNLPDLDALYQLVLRDIGADKLKLNILQPSFGLPGEYDDVVYAKQLVRNTGTLRATIEACDRKYSLGVNPVWLDQVVMYHDSMHAGGQVRRGWQAAGTSAHICGTYDRNIMLDRYGVARLCFSHEFPGARLESGSDLRAFWEGWDDTRARMRQCNRPCGISHSVRRESATIRR